MSQGARHHGIVIREGTAASGPARDAAARCSGASPNDLLSHRGASAALCLVLLVLFFAVPAMQAQEKPRDNGLKEHEAPDTALQRLRWFHRARALPNGTIPAAARLNALRQRDAMIQRIRQGLQPGFAAAAAVTPAAPWTLIGPQPTSGGFFGNASGRVKALVIDPTDPTGNTVYLGGAQGGVWKTTNGGTTWTPLTDDQPSLAIGSIALAPSAPSTIYVGTGEQAGFGFDVYYGAGILKSTDSGITWTQTGTPPGAPFVGPFGPGFFPGGGARIGSLAVNPTNPNLVLAGVQIFTGTNSGAGIPGIYCTNDSGTNWSLLSSPRGAVGNSVIYVSSTTAYASLGRTLNDPDNGIYKSTNANANCAAQTWSRLPTTGLPAQTSFGRIVLAAGPGANPVLYAAIANGSSQAQSQTLLGVFVSTNGGTSWTKLVNTPDFCQQQCWYDLTLAVDPADNTGNTVFAGGSARPSGTLVRTTNGTSANATWTAASTPTQLHVDHHALAFTSTGSKLYVGNDGGVWSSANPTAASPTWVNLNSTLSLSQFYPGLSLHPSTDSVSFGGTQDNGAQKYSGALNWNDTGACGDGGWTVIDPFVPSTVFVTCQFIAIGRSFQNGNPGSFAEADTGINQNDDVNFIPPFVGDPFMPNRLYFGTNRLWQTNDSGTTWNAISGTLVGANAFLTAIAPAPAKVVYTGGVDGSVRRTDNADANPASFVNVTSGLPPNDREITQIVTDPSDATGHTAYVLFSGFSGIFSGVPSDTKGHIFKTTNGGLVWTDVSCHVTDCSSPGPTDLPNIPVNDLVIDPDDPTSNTLYAGTDIGVFATSDGGTTWAPLGTGLPNVAVFSLKLRDASRTLRASTHGRSVWQVTLPALAGTPSFGASSISPFSRQAGSGSFTLTVSGNGFTASSQIQWNGATTGITMLAGGTATQLQATIAANLIAQSGTAQITVTDSGPPAQTSNALPLTISGAVPSVTSVTPNTATAGSASVNLTITGANFAGDAVATWSGSTTGITTNTRTATQITATISGTLLQFGGVFAVGVTNPPPGGGPSNAVAFTVTSVPPVNDNFANATAVTSATFSDTVDSFAATTEATDPTPSTSCVAAGTSTNPRTKTVWYKVTPATNGTITADTIGSAYDTILTVITGSAPGTQVACNDDIVPGVNQQSRVSFSATAGTTYSFMVSPFDPQEQGGPGFGPTQIGGLGQGGKTVFNYSGPAPGTAGLSVTPASRTITAGQSATFTITPASPPFSGQVSLTVTGCPPVSACTFSPTSVAPGSASTLTVTTTARAFIPGSPAGPWQPLPLVWVLLIAAILSTTAFAARLTRKRRLAVYLPLLALLLLLAFQVVGCGGGGGGGGGTGTTAGTYTLTITGTAGTTTSTTSATVVVN